mmetsp:Transcript_25832/g.45885  ORF Transcript_25832/g.45885 Transcript_25832/m.45885 type:complete len:205 (+) Transcript_25832:160-774(+)
MASSASPVSLSIFLVRFPLARGAILAKSPSNSGSNSMSRISSAIWFLNTRVALCKVLNTTVVDRSSASRRRCLIESLIGASFVARKRVAIVMPTAPIARAAASCLPVPDAPLATIGMSGITSRALVSATQSPISSPGCPPAMLASYPTISMRSTPHLRAFSAWRSVADLCSTLTPASWKSFMYFFGLPPATSTIVTFSSATTCA